MTQRRACSAPNPMGPIGPHPCHGPWTPWTMGPHPRRGPWDPTHAMDHGTPPTPWAAMSALPSAIPVRDMNHEFEYRIDRIAWDRAVCHTSLGRRPGLNGAVGHRGQCWEVGQPDTQTRWNATTMFRPSPERSQDCRPPTRRYLRQILQAVGR